MSGYIRRCPICRSFCLTESSLYASPLRSWKYISPFSWPFSWPWSAWCAFRSFEMFPYEFVVFCCQIATAGEKGCSAEVLQKAGVVIDSLCWVHRCTAYDSYVTTCPGVIKRPDLAKLDNNMLQLCSAYFGIEFGHFVHFGLRLAEWKVPGWPPC